MKHSARVRCLLLCTLACVAFTGLRCARADTVLIIQNNFGSQDYGFRLISSDPYDYQKIDQAPPEIVLTFSQPIEESASKLEITDLFGSKLTDGRVTSEGNRMVAAMPALQQGKYKVKWKAQCRCAAQTQIDDVFRFTVR